MRPPDAERVWGRILPHAVRGSERHASHQSVSELPRELPDRASASDGVAGFESLTAHHSTRRPSAARLDSDEKDNPPTTFKDVFNRAGSEGYHLTMHCDVDQEDSVEHIWQCLNDIVGKGVKS